MPLARVIEVNVSEGEHICAALCADTDHSIHALPGASEDSVPDVSENRCPDCAMQCTEFQRCNPRPRCKRYPELMVVEAPVYPALWHPATSVWLAMACHQWSSLTSALTCHTVPTR